MATTPANIDVIDVDVVVAAISLLMFLASYCGGHSGAAETPTKSHDLRSTATDVANFEPSQMWSSACACGFMDAAAYELHPFYTSSMHESCVL